jgi:predicted nuclease of predicted toxin-antitoxin system
MKLLFDQNLSFRLCRVLADVFPDSMQTGSLGLSRADDRTVWEAARAGGFTLVSLDADFAEMALLLGPPPKVLWLRCGNQPTSVIADLLRRHAEAIRTFETDNTAACLEIY